MPSQPKPQLNRKGYLYGLGAAAAFVTMVTLVKLCRDNGISSRSIVFYRSFVVLPCCFLLCRGISMKVERVGYLVGRIIFGFAAMTTSFAAMRWINIIEINLLFNLQPLLVAASAPLILGASERPDSRTLMALVAALIGSSIIIGPELNHSLSFDGNSRLLGLCLGAIGALCGALAHVCLRGLQKTPVIVTVTWFQICVAALALIPFDGEPLMKPSFANFTSLALIGVGLSAFVGQLCLTKAYQVLPAVNASTLGYSAPIFGIFMDLAIFTAVPTGTTLLGGALIVLSGLWWIQPSMSSTDETTSASH